MSDKPPVVVIIDDDAPVCLSLRLLLETAGLRVRTYSSAESFLRDLHPERRGCLLVDVRMPGMSGIELLGELARRRIELPAVVMTGHGEIETAVQAMKMGAFDFIQKPFTEANLLERVRAAIEADRLRRAEDRDREEIGIRFATLSRREREVLEHLVRGEVNKTIAHALGITLKTVEFHRARIMRKMHADSFASLVKMAHLCGVE
jgi:FixJ family two-component response regulator